MPTLQKINLGTPPAGKDGESTRAGFVKMNANVDVLSAQAALTSVAPIISTAIELDSTYLGARVILQPTAAATLTWPKASTCSPDGVIMIVNASAYPISHSVRAGDTFVNSVAFGPWETALVSTDGVNTWRVLIRSRATSSNEQVSGSLSVGGRLLVGGAHDDGSSDLQVKGTANISKFSSRPMFAGNTPWDSGNFDPASKLNIAGRTDGVAPAAGNVGEIITTSNSAVSLPGNRTPVGTTTLNLRPGEWDVQGSMIFNYNASSVLLKMAFVGVATSSGSITAGQFAGIDGLSTQGWATFVTPMVRFRFSTATIVWLNAWAGANADVPGFGHLTARRVAA
ncbi:hypothetical protein [Burkholderia vietnamiensis]|uniref:hypothetical protein n=1 Tax=Burkholderia vietnamiensis TaxID=60552 RepID=UPI0015930FC0|nr:hypothetical protein [Burkholderia vietnamiensis]